MQSPPRQFARDYWIVAHRETVIETNGCRVHIDHLARVRSARLLMDHNRRA